MEVLVDCRLIALGLECSGVEGGSASDVNGLCGFRGENERM